MKNSFIVRQSGPLRGNVAVGGAKNAALTIMASLILVSGVSVISNVPLISDITRMVNILSSLGAVCDFDRAARTLTVDTSGVHAATSLTECMGALRASILIAGPLLARFGCATLALPGGCPLGPRPIDYHVDGFIAMGGKAEHRDEALEVTLSQKARSQPGRTIFLEYPSVGATENLMMCAAALPGLTKLINPAFEPEVMDLATVLEKMGATITFPQPGVMYVQGRSDLKPVNHALVSDRMEPGSLLLAIAATGGQGGITNARSQDMGIVLHKLTQMGHEITTKKSGDGIFIKARPHPRAVSFRTGPYPAFPTDLQAPMMAAQLVAQGKSVVTEDVFADRLRYVEQFHRMGARIVQQGTRVAILDGGRDLVGTTVHASNIREAYALVIAGLIAKGETVVEGVQHLERGYELYAQKLQQLGAGLVTPAKQVSSQDLQIAQQLRGL